MNGGEGGGDRAVSTFTPWTPILPIVTALEAVIPPTWVPLPLRPVTVTKYDKTSVFASHDMISVLGLFEQSTANSVLSACGVTVWLKLGKSSPASAPMNSVTPVKIDSYASIACFHASMNT